MLVLELFAGTRSIGKAFERKGHEVVSIDYDTTLPDMKAYVDIGTLSCYDIYLLLGSRLPDVIWASPDCTTYSIAAISHHRYYQDGFLKPKSQEAIKSDEVVTHLLSVINRFATIPHIIWFIENPRGGLRKMQFMSPFQRYTVTYCQYGDSRMKPTDIWTNARNPNFKPPCHNGDSCHQSAPRGSKTGTQGLMKRDRSRIPDALCDYIVEICEKEVSK